MIATDLFKNKHIFEWWLIPFSRIEPKEILLDFFYSIFDIINKNNYNVYDLRVSVEIKQNRSSRLVFILYWKSSNTNNHKVVSMIWIERNGSAVKASLCTAHNVLQNCISLYRIEYRYYITNGCHTTRNVDIDIKQKYTYTYINTCLKRILFDVLTIMLYSKAGILRGQIRAMMCVNRCSLWYPLLEWALMYVVCRAWKNEIIPVRGTF